MNYKLISSIVKGAWAIDLRTAVQMGPFVFSLLKGENVLLDQKAERPYYIENTNSSDQQSEEKVRVIPVKGILMKDDQDCGPVGMATLGKWVKSADNDPSVSSIILDIDTPGGSVDGIEVFADIIKNTQKPVIGFVNGLMASAGMWVGSACDKLIASTELDEIGSIGVMLSFADMQPAWEAQGVKFHEIYSSLSKDKNADIRKIREGDYDDYIKNVLDPFAEKFQNVIRENRPGVKDKQLTGKVYFAKKLTGTLIDEIGTFEYAVSEAQKLAKSNTNINKQAMSIENKTPFADESSAKNWFQRTFGLKSVDDQNAEAELKELEDLKSKVAQFEADLSAKEAELQNAVDKITDLETQITELKGSAGAKPVLAIKETDGKEDADPAKIHLPEGADVVEQFEALKNALDKARN